VAKFIPPEIQAADAGNGNKTPLPASASTNKE